MTSRLTRRQYPTIVVASGYRAGLVRATRRANEKTSAPGGSFTERFTAPFASGQQRPIVGSRSHRATIRSSAPSVRSVSEFRRQTQGASEKRSPRFAVLTKPMFTSFSRRTIPSCALRNSVVRASLPSLTTTMRAQGGAKRRTLSRQSRVERSAL